MSLTFQGTLMHNDTKKHVAHHFEIPEDATRLHITFAHQPHRAEGAAHANQVSLSLFDPHGFRGARHNNLDQTIRLSSAEATPGYIPGELPAGQWTVLIDTHRILPPDPLQYTIKVDFSTVPIAEPPLTYTVGATAPRGPGWYRGDLHGHTLHSDGKWDVPDFVQYAQDRNFDFVTLSDHNTVSGLAQLDSLRNNDVLTMGGMELTTYYGHALALGTRQWQEWRIINGKTITDLARTIINEGVFFIIAHPKSPGDPVCTGCRWEFEEMMPGIAPAVEIWNGSWQQYNEDGLQLYYQWLNAGHKLVATAGSDIHGKPPDNVTGSAVNVVYAQVLSEAGILDAIRQGHLYLSDGPDIRLTAKSDGNAEIMMGDTLVANSPIQVQGSWGNVSATNVVRLIVDGKVYDESSAKEASEKSWILEAATTQWLLLEVRGDDQQMRSITNPLFIEATG